MLQRFVLPALAVAWLALMVTPLARAETTRVTITGVSHALSDPNSKMDPAAANATVAVSANGVNSVYYVHGWAGVICAKNDGKTVQVTGVVGQDSKGNKTITARSIDVKVIVVQ